MAETATVTEKDPREIHELWEVMVPGTIWVWVRDVRIPGQYKKTRVGGKAGGSRKLRITTDERRYNEEQVIEEMLDHNPFRNGFLRLVSVDEDARPDDILANYHLTDKDLLAYFEVKDADVFKEGVQDIESELILRRLFSLAREHGSVAQFDVLQDLVEERYKVGGTQKTVREMIAAGEVDGGERLS